MRKRKRRLIVLGVVLVLAVIALLILYSVGLLGRMDAHLSPLPAASPLPAGEEIPFGDEEWLVVGASEGLTLSMRPSDGNFYVETAAGSRWYANPLDAQDDAWATRVYKLELSSSLIVNYYDLEDKQTVKKNSETVCVRKKALSYARLENGFVTQYRFEDAGLTIPVEIYLEDDHLVVRVVTSQITEEKPERYLLASIRLLPNFGAGGAEDEGYVFVPDGEGALMFFNNGKGGASEYRAGIYGDNLSVTNLFRPADVYRASLPVFGVKKNESAFLAVVAGGDAVAKLVAAPSMQNSTYCSVYPEYGLRLSDRYVLDESSSLAQTITLYQTGGMETPLCEQRYYFLEGEQADYNGMASRYRQYLMDEKAVAPTQDETALFLDYYAAVSRRESIVGVPVTVQRQLSALEDVQLSYQALREETAGSMRLRLLSWTKQGLEGRLQIHPTWAAGNDWPAWNALSDTLQQHGDSAALGIEIAEFSKGGSGVTMIRESAQALSGSPAFQYQYLNSTRMRGGTARRSCLLHPALLNDMAEDAAAALARHDVDGVSVLTLPWALYGSYGSGNFASAQQTIQAVEGVLTQFGGMTVIADEANAYVLPYADYVTNVPQGSSRYDAMDQSVPFLQMVYGGLVGYAGRPINLSDNPEEAFLHAIATGEALHFSLITGDAELLIETNLNQLFSAQEAVWRPQIIAWTNAAEEAQSARENSRLVRYTQPAEAVSISRFENGAEICVNCSQTEYDWQGTAVPPMTYRIREAIQE